MDKEPFQKYYREIRKIFRKENYTEYTFRTPFQNFIQELDEKFDLFQEPKRKCDLGAPDFKAFRNGAKVGYIETKNLGNNLDEELESKQLEKYINNIDNIILSNYNRFILIRNGEKVFDFNLLNVSDLRDSEFSISKNKAEKFLEMLESFYGYEIKTIKSPEELAKELSRRARLLKDLSKKQLENDLEESKDEEKSPVYDFYLGMREMKDLGTEDCADAYAQTIAYGLFLAKINNKKEKIIRKTASTYVPNHIGIIKKIFRNISGDVLPSNIGWIVEEIIDILNASEMDTIESKINSRQQKDKDPYIYFYEDFLTRFDPEKKKHLGVFYTPRPVVNFIVNSIHGILKKHFNKPRGLADNEVKALDPAIGTGTFFWIAFLVVMNELKKSGMSGMIEDKIKNHILENFYGLEILITPYIISHLKLMGLLNSWYYEFDEDDELQIYLTNTLEPVETHGLMPFLREITKETKAANRIITEEPVLAIMGNPPYSVSSSNKSDWIEEKMVDYKKDLNERNIQPLSDDYIKFLRFAQWKIEQNGEGVIGFITNNSYLNGRIHRRMREEILNTFDKIYILNLHGSSRKKEKTPSDISKDENVFDIRQGVAISLFVKSNGIEEEGVFYSDLYGERGCKFTWLDKHSNKKSFNSLEWKKLDPEPPYYLFVETEEVSPEMKKIYNNSFKLSSIFEDYSIGIVSGNDTNRVSFDEESNNYTYDYRPFDKRYINLYSESIQRPRLPFMKNFEEENIALVSSKQSKGKFRHVFITNNFSSKQFISDSSYIFPLYKYNGTKKPNLAEEFTDFIDEKYPDKDIGLKDILGYIYGLLHSESYSEKFNKFLKIDFPRIPFVNEYRKFEEISNLGKKLIDFHLMKKKFDSDVEFDIKGSNEVKKYKYNDKKIYINEKQFFGGISEEVWSFKIGGYQVLRKWLKYRKGRELDSEEVEHFIQMVEVIKKTKDLMKKIDEIKIF